MPDSLRAMDCSPPGSSVHGVSQARVPERVVISFSWGSSRPRNPISVSCISRRFLYHRATREAFCIPIGHIYFRNWHLSLSLEHLNREKKKSNTREWCNQKAICWWNETSDLKSLEWIYYKNARRRDVEGCIC